MLQGLFPDTGEAATEKIRMGRLGDFVSAEDIKAPAMLKLDVQGFELETQRKKIGWFASPRMIRFAK